MSLLSIILAAHGGHLIQNLAQAANSEPTDVQKVVENVLPVLSKALKDKTADKSGAESLLDFIKSNDIASLINDPQKISDEALATTGGSILSFLFGQSSPQTRIVSLLTSRTGLGGDVIGGLLPVVTSLALSGISNQISIDEVSNHLGRIQPPATGLFGRLIGFFTGASAPEHVGIEVFGSILDSGVAGDEGWVAEAFTPDD